MFFFREYLDVDPLYDKCVVIFLARDDENFKLEKHFYRKLLRDLHSPASIIACPVPANNAQLAVAAK